MCAASVDKGLREGRPARCLVRRDGNRGRLPVRHPRGLARTPNLPVTRVENSCATGNDAVRNALFGVASGAFDVALVMGADSCATPRRRTCCGSGRRWRATWRWDYPLGLVSPAGFALHVQPATCTNRPRREEHLAMVAVKNHRHGVNNPKARLRFEITIEQALAAPTVVTPFGLYDCAPQSDGAAALVLRGRGRGGPLHRSTGVDPWCRPRAGLGDASAQAGHDNVSRRRRVPPSRRLPWPA